MERKPVVSIITPVLNREKFIRQSMESVLTQNSPHVEHVIVDGGSSDGTMAIVTDLAARHPDRVRYISEPDRGACDAWNKGWKIARGDIFGWLGADDFYEADAVATIVRFFDADPEASFVYGECNIVDENGATIGRYATTDYDRRRALNEANGIAAMAAFYRRELVETIGSLDTSINLCDCDFWIRAGEHCHLHRIPETLSNFRMHEGSVTRRLQQSVYLKENFLLNRRYGGSMFSPVCRRYFKSLLFRPRARTSLPYFSRVAIFGAALSGQECYAAVTNRGMSVAFFIDNFPPPNETFLGKPVYRPRDIPENEIDAVFIASAGRVNEMKKDIKRLKLKKPVVVY